MYSVMRFTWFTLLILYPYNTVALCEKRKQKINSIVFLDKLHLCAELIADGAGVMCLVQYWQTNVHTPCVHVTMLVVILN